MPEILRMFGMRFYFYSREHEPIHVHVKNADGKAKFDILPEGIVLVKNEGIKTKDIKAAEMVLEENKELAIEKWNEYFGRSVKDEDSEDLELISLHGILGITDKSIDILKKNEGILKSLNTIDLVACSNVKNRDNNYIKKIFKNVECFQVFF